MAYIGKGLVGVLSENKAIDTMSNPNGVVTTMTLSRTPGSVNNVEVYIDGIFQTPGDEYTLEGDVLTFTTAPATNAVVIAVVGNDSTIANVDNNSITGAMIPDGSVTDSKISGIVSTKISGTLPALDGSSLTNLTVGNLEGTLPALDGSPLTGVQGFRKNASDPLVTSNGTQGDVWVNTTSGEVYVLTDATTDANVWTNVGEGTGAQPFNGMVATGGTITTDGDYKVHTFNSSDPFEVTTLGDIGTVEVLVVAGGGSGGSGYGGGGGAGGVVHHTTKTVTATSFPVVIGAGGSSVTSAGDGNTGNDSTIFSMTAKGGGFGGGYDRASGDGGCGGGESTGNAANTEKGSTNQGAVSGATVYGNNGGEHNLTGAWHAAGGGGAGAAGGAPDNSGSNGANGFAGDGGAGVFFANFTHAGTSGTNTGTSGGYFAGGGGGGSEAFSAFANYLNGGNGGAGGGVQHYLGTNNNGPGGSGLVNTGGGGAGNTNASTSGSTPATGAGGSGIVMIRYKFQ